MKRVSTVIVEFGEYESPTLFITETPPEQGFQMSTGKGDIDNPNEEEWTDPWG